MTVDQVREVLFWSSSINIVLLLVGGIGYKFMRKTIHTHYGKKFTITPGEINLFIFKVFSYYKMAILLLNIVPFIALSIVAKSPVMS